MTTFGEVSWNDDVFAGENKKQTNSKDLFLRLDEGSNEMRIITQPFQYLVHKHKKEGDTGFGQKVSCSMIAVPYVPMVIKPSHAGYWVLSVARPIPIKSWTFLSLSSDKFVSMPETPTVGA